MKPDPFDSFLGDDFEGTLQENCFKVMQMTALVAQNPVENAYYIKEIKEVVIQIEESLDEIGLSGEGVSDADIQKLDVVDLLFLRGAEGLKKYFQNFGRLEEFDDDDDDRE